MLVLQVMAKTSCWPGNQCLRTFGALSLGRNRLIGSTLMPLDLGSCFKGGCDPQGGLESWEKGGLWDSGGNNLCINNVLSKG